jgi:hypothetical protein
MYRMQVYDERTTGMPAGIHTTSAGNRIEENHVVFNNNAGIKVDSVASTVLRNTSRFNNGSTATASNYVFVNQPGNIVGTIVTSAATLNAANNSNVNISN